MQDTKLDSGEPANQRETQYTWDTATNRMLTSKSLGPGSAPIALTTYTYTPSSTCSHNRICSTTIQNLSSNGVSNQLQTTTYSYQFYSSGIPSQIVVNGPLAGPSGYVVRNYDAAGNLSSSADAAGNTTTYTGYDGLGHPASVSDPNGYTINFTYDARGRILTRSRTVDGVLGTTTYTYDGLGDVTSIQNADGGLTLLTYDAVGRLTQKTFGGDTTTKTTSSNGTTTTTTNTVWQSFTYDTLNDVLSNTINGQKVVSCEQNNIVVNSPNQVTPLFTSCTTSTTNTTYYSHTASYDSVGRTLSDNGANGQHVQYSYDANGNVLTKTDSTGKVWTYTYNALNQLQTATDPLGHQTRYGYDGAGHLGSVTDPKGNITTYYFDGFGNLTKTTSPDTGMTTYVYDTLGRLTQFTRNDGTTTTYSSFDNLNRAHTITAGGLTHTYTYDSCTNGRTRICSFADASGSTSYTYRQTGQLASQTSIIAGASYTTSWSYDKNDWLTAISYPGGNTVTYAYDGLELSSITANVGGTNYTVGSFGFTPQTYGLLPPAEIVMGDSTTVAWARDQDLRLTGLSAIGYSTIQSLSYTYDTNNNITKITNALNSNLTQTFGNDLIYQLNSVTAGVGNQAVSFDNNSSRTSYTWGGAVDAYTPNSYNNQISSISGTRARSFGYDAVGNLHTVTGWNGNRTYTYDGFNHLASVNNAGATTNYTYNALGQRAQKSGATGTFKYVYGPDGTLLAETAANSNTITSQYIWYAGAPIGLIRNGTLYFVHTDHLGRPDTVTNSSEAIVWQAQNTAFDRTVTTNTIGGLNLGFPGQYYDSESGLNYNINRYYDPTMGAYNQSDLVGLQGGLNSYAYAYGNPTMATDPLGLDPPYISPSTFGYVGGTGGAAFGSYVGMGGAELLGFSGAMAWGATALAGSWDAGVYIGTNAYDLISYLIFDFRIPKGPAPSGTDGSSGKSDNSSPDGDGGSSQSSSGQSSGATAGAGDGGKGGKGNTGGKGSSGGDCDSKWNFIRGLPRCGY